MVFVSLGLGWFDSGFGAFGLWLVAYCWFCTLFVLFSCFDCFVL